MSQLFRGRSEADNQRLERELAILEQQVRTASPGYETQYLNQAGNLCVDSGQPKRAMGYYGRAIDAYLESGRFSAAEVLCQKLIRLAPNAVRARCTLAWLAIGRGFRAATDQELSDYVRSAQRASMEELAVKQLLLMAEAASSHELRQIIGNHLLDLGAYEAADRVLGDVFAERNELRPSLLQDEGKLWDKLLRAALLSPEELQGHGLGGTADDSLPALGG